MGERVGIAIVDKDGETSPIIIQSHYLGRKLLGYAQQFMNEVKDNDRFMREDCYVHRIIAMFIMWLYEKGYDKLHHDLCIQLDEDGDTEDHGIFEMNFQEMTVS